ncbi:DoxX family protein [Aquabacterium sp.]|uniref:DoxX family protein n=1 Tax=Aquabacterium sp. TaxID=1872578 RepID=UPI003783C3DE
MTPALTATPLAPFQSSAQALGRVLIALLFVPAGWGKVTTFAGVVGYIASKGVPLPELCAAAAIAIELGLGLLLLVGWQTRWVALGLAIFVLVITPIFHNFWAQSGAQATAQLQLFYKNVAVIGGLLYIALFGAGKLSLDARAGRD